MAVERAAINAPIQGTAADIMKIAMVRLHNRLRAGSFRARMLLQVHDELVLEAPPEEIEVVAALVRSTMAAPMRWPSRSKWTSRQVPTGATWHRSARCRDKP